MNESCLLVPFQLLVLECSFDSSLAHLLTCPVQMLQCARWPATPTTWPSTATPSERTARAATYCHVTASATRSSSKSATAHALGRSHGRKWWRWGLAATRFTSTGRCRPGSTAVASSCRTASPPASRCSGSETSSSSTPTSRLASRSSGTDTAVWRSVYVRLSRLCARRTSEPKWIIIKSGWKLLLKSVVFWTVSSYYLCRRYSSLRLLSCFYRQLWPAVWCCLVFTGSFVPLCVVVFNTQLCPTGCCRLVFTGSFVPMGVVLFLHAVMSRWVLLSCFYTQLCPAGCCLGFYTQLSSRCVLLSCFYTQLCPAGCCFVFTRSYVPLGAVVFLHAGKSHWVLFRFLHAVMSRWVVLSCLLHLKFQCPDTPTPSVIRALESRQLQVSVCVCAGDGQWGAQRPPVRSVRQPQRRSGRRPAGQAGRGGRQRRPVPAGVAGEWRVPQTRRTPRLPPQRPLPAHYRRRRPGADSVRGLLPQPLRRLRRQDRHHALHPVRGRGQNQATRHLRNFSPFCRGGGGGWRGGARTKPHFWNFSPFSIGGLGRGWGVGWTKPRVTSKTYLLFFF